MAAAISPITGRRYGIAQVCRIWEVPRSSFYADRHRADTTTPVPAQRRGPKPVISDDALLAAIRVDLARSPWHGEGHRKVWARLRVMDGIRVARKRVLRLMRENALLSPHRARRRDDTPHDRHIITEAPNIMWGDGRDPDHHRSGRQGLAVRRDRTLERRNAGLARRQARRSLRGRPGRRHGNPECLRPRQPQRRPRRGAATRPRQRVPRRTFPQPDPLLGHDPQLCVRRRARDERRHRAVFPHPQGADRAWPNLSDHRRGP
jgi:HTH-like domain